jgi:hypothetical protein
MRSDIGLVMMIAASLTLQGCIGVGAWTLGSRTESSDRPKIDQTSGSRDLKNVGIDGNLKTSADIRARWGEPDRVVSREGGKEEWIYKTDGLRWSGLVLYVVVIPLPAVIPVGSQYVSFFIHDGHIESASRTDWSFKGAAYCGFFGMMYGGWQCETGTFEEKQGPASAS